MRVVKTYDLRSNEVHQFPARPYLLALLPLASTMAINVLRSEWPPLRSPPALPFSDLCLLVILDHYKIRLTTVVIKFLTILLIAQLKNIITAIITRTARVMWTKARPRTATIEATTVAIWMMTTLGTATAVIATRVMRPAGV